MASCPFPLPKNREPLTSAAQPHTLPHRPQAASGLPRGHPASILTGACCRPPGPHREGKQAWPQGLRRRLLEVWLPSRASLMGGRGDRGAALHGPDRHAGCHPCVSSPGQVRWVAGLRLAVLHSCTNRRGHTSETVLPKESGLSLTTTPGPTTSLQGILGLGQPGEERQGHSQGAPDQARPAGQPTWPFPQVTFEKQRH